MTYWKRKEVIVFKSVGWLQIVGGVTGLGLIAYLLMNTGAISGPHLLIFILGISLFVFSIYAGKRLLTDDNKIVPIYLSIVNQLVQVFQWSVFGYGLTYSSGAELAIGIVETTFKFDLSVVKSSFYMSINSGSDFMLKVNLVPIVLIYILLQVKRTLQLEVHTEEIEYDEYSEIETTNPNTH